MLEAAIMKKNLEGWSPSTSGMDSRATGAPGALGTLLQGWFPSLEALPSCGPQRAVYRVLAVCDCPERLFSVLPQNLPLPATPPPLQPPQATSTATLRARSTPRSQEAKGRKTETSRLAESRCQRSGGSPCSARSPTPMSSSTWTSSYSTRWGGGGSGGRGCESSDLGLPRRAGTTQQSVLSHHIRTHSGRGTESPGAQFQHRKFQKHDACS